MFFYQEEEDRQSERLVYVRLLVPFVVAVVVNTVPSHCWPLNSISKQQQIVFNLNIGGGAAIISPEGRLLRTNPDPGQQQSVSKSCTSIDI